MHAKQDNIPHCDVKLDCTFVVLLLLKHLWYGCPLIGSSDYTRYEEELGRQGTELISGICK